MILPTRNLIALSLLLGGVSGLFASSDTNTNLLASLTTPVDKTPVTSSSMGTYYYKPDSQEFFTYADWLYWKPVTDPIDWCAVSNYQVGSISTDTESGLVDVSGDYLQSQQKNLTFPYASGFRVGLGYRFKENQAYSHSWPWQFESSFERLNTAASSNINTQGILATEYYTTTGLFPTTQLVITEGVALTSPDTVGATIYPQSIYSSGQSKMSLDYNRGDVKFAWPFWLKESAILRLATGATFAYFDSKWSQSFQVFSLPGAHDIPLNTNQSLQWNWFGGGVFAAGDIAVEIGKGVGIYADTSFAVLYGKMNEQEKFANYTSSGDRNYYLHVTRNLYSFQPVVKFAAGLNYKHWFSSILLYTSAGWEFNYWFNMNQFGKIYSREGNPGVGRYFMQTKPQSLLFEGLTMRLGIEF